MFLSVRDRLVTQEADTDDQAGWPELFVWLWIVYIWNVAKGFMLEYVFARVRLKKDVSLDR